MPASTPVRVAILIAALAALLGGYWWWSNPARHVHRLLSEVASALSHDGPEADLRSIATVASLQAHLTPDVSVDIGGSSTPLRGRPDVIAMAARLRASSPMMRVQFFDPEIRFSDDSSGTTRVTVQVTRRDAGGQEVAAAHVVSVALVRADGRWQIASARILPEDATL
jgi:hypothetical protein